MVLEPTKELKYDENILINVNEYLWKNNGN